MRLVKEMTVLFAVILAEMAKIMVTRKVRRGRMLAGPRNQKENLPSES